MKKAIHVTIEDEILSDLNEISKKMKMNRSALVEGVIEKGIEDIRKLNYNFTQFINK